MTTLDKIKELISLIVRGNFNSLNIRIPNSVDELWFHKPDCTLSFDHWTGYDTERVQIENGTHNSYICDSINDNFDELVNIIKLASSERRENSIL